MKIALMSLGDKVDDPITGRRFSAPERYAMTLDAPMIAERTGIAGYHIGEHHGIAYTFSSPAVDPLMDQLAGWLPTAIPPDDEIAITHGDFRIDNVIFHPKERRIVAVLNWELSTLGHPLADFAYCATMYRVPPTILPGLAGTK